ncbi:MAG: copper chaperone PCu(A)C [Beijerinckiaceae bacterium]
MAAAIAIVALSAIAGAMSAIAAPPIKAGALAIEAPWLRATPGGAKVAAGYLRITNRGSEPDRLIGASIPLARSGEVHEMSMQNGVMHMRALAAGVIIAPGRTIELRPAGLHLMFVDLKGALKEGESIEGTLSFEKAGSVPVTFAIGGLGGAPPAVGSQSR